MLQDKTFIIISGLIDATIKEYQPDVDFKIFHNIDELREYIEHDPIRAQLLFFTADVTGVSNTAFSVLEGIVSGNDYLQVDKVIYIANEDNPNIRSFKYLVSEKELVDWELITGPMSRAFIQEVVNGTYRGDTFNPKRKMVIRRPRADYLKQQMKAHATFEEDYPDDDNDLSDIADEELPVIEIDESPAQLSYVYIAGKPTRERTAFALLTAQYISKSHRVIILESDPEYHLLTEFATKAKLDAAVFYVTDLYDDLNKTLQAIRESENNLVIVQCIDRIRYDYRYLHTLLYYNLDTDFDYFVIESPIADVPENTHLVVTLPTTVTGVLENCEGIDKSMLPYCDFVGIDLKDLPETHISSGTVVSKILHDILSDNSIVCPVVTMSSLRLNGASYDLGIVLGRSLSA